MAASYRYSFVIASCEAPKARDARYEGLYGSFDYTPGSFKQYLPCLLSWANGARGVLLLSDQHGRLFEELDATNVPGTRLFSDPGLTYPQEAHTVALPITVVLKALSEQHVNLHGVPGSGKTRLMALLRELSSRMPRQPRLGQWFITQVVRESYVDLARCTNVLCLPDERSPVADGRLTPELLAAYWLAPELRRSALCIQARFRYAALTKSSQRR